MCQVVLPQTVQICWHVPVMQAGMRAVIADVANNATLEQCDSCIPIAPTNQVVDEVERSAR